MSAVSNKHCSGHRKATEEEENQRKRETGYRNMNSRFQAGIDVYVKRQHKTEFDLDELELGACE